MNEQAITSPVMVNRIVISYVKMEAVAALPILFDTDVRHCATVSPECNAVARQSCRRGR